MDHIVVAIRPGQGPGVISWALRHARAHGGALEIIASGLEWPDPHSLVAIASTSVCPVVIVPADWRADAETGSAPVTEALAASAVEACIDRLCATAAPLRIVPTSFVASARQRVTG